MSSWLYRNPWSRELCPTEAVIEDSNRFSWWQSAEGMCLKCIISWRERTGAVVLNQEKMCARASLRVCACVCACFILHVSVSPCMHYVNLQEISSATLKLITSVSRFSLQFICYFNFCQSVINFCFVYFFFIRFFKPKCKIVESVPLWHVSALNNTGPFLFSLYGKHHKHFDHKWQHINWDNTDSGPRLWFILRSDPHFTPGSLLFHSDHVID